MFTFPIRAYVSLEGERNPIMARPKMAQQLAISERLNGDVTVLDLAGNLTFGEGTTLLRREVRRLVDAGQRKVLLNFASVRFLDSAGMGELISGYTALTREGGQLKLVNLRPNVMELMVLTKLVTILDVYDSESRAINDYQ